MTDQKAHQLIGDLQARCTALEARLASLTAFSAAMLEFHPQRDVLLTKWATLQAAALEQFAALDEFSIQQCALIPAWVDHHKELKR